jgi:hypothetical protein
MNKFGSARRLLLAAAIMTAPALLARPAAAQVVGISVALAPPALQVYQQPPMPGDGYLWTPGYWAYDVADGYYWVPGAWVLPPTVGVLWTPPYWGWSNGAYLFHDGYWGPHVGFYGGVNYGFGYGGGGYDGGRWDGGHFAYNREANNFGAVHINNVYSAHLNVHENSRVSYAGGAGGLRSEPTARDRVAEHEQHQQGVTRADSHAGTHVAAGQGQHPTAPAAAHTEAARVAATQHPAAARPEQHAAQAAPRPVQHAAPRPAPQQQREAARPPQQAPRPQAHAAAPARQEAHAAPAKGGEEKRVER